MPLSPQEIESKQFLTVLRGFDPEEVKAFLERVADDVRVLLTTLYAALPPVGATAESRADLDELLLHSERVTGEVARLVEAGRAANIDAAALRREAEAEAEAIRAICGQERLEAVRQASRILAQARDEARMVLARARVERNVLGVEMRRVAERLAEIEATAHVLRTRALGAVDDRQPSDAPSDA